MMKNETLLEELEILCQQSGYQVRKERGSFRGDACVIEGDKLIVINKNRPPESQIGTLARVLRAVNLDDIYVKPAVRKRLRDLWERIDRLEQEPLEATDEEGS